MLPRARANVRQLAGSVRRAVNVRVLAVRERGERVAYMDERAAAHLLAGMPVPAVAKYAGLVAARRVDGRRLSGRAGVRRVSRRADNTTRVLVEMAGRLAFMATEEVVVRYGALGTARLRDGNASATGTLAAVIAVVVARTRARCGNALARRADVSVLAVVFVGAPVAVDGNTSDACRVMRHEGSRLARRASAEVIVQDGVRGTVRDVRMLGAQALPGVARVAIRTIARGVARPGGTEVMAVDCSAALMDAARSGGVA